MDKQPKDTSKAIKKPRGKGVPFRKGSGENRDPRIQPRRVGDRKENTWAGTFTTLLEMTPDELIEMVGGKYTPLGKIFDRLPKEQNIKTTMALKAIAQYAQTPKHTPLLDSIMNRTDGTPRQTVILGGQIATKNYVGWTPDQWDAMNASGDTGEENNNKQEDVPEDGNDSSTTPANTD